MTIYILNSYQYNGAKITNLSVSSKLFAHFSYVKEIFLLRVRAKSPTCKRKNFLV